MFRRFFLLLLIALLPLQGIAASFMVKCVVPASAPVMQVGDLPCHGMGGGDEMGSGQPQHIHDGDETAAGNALDLGCCHHLAVAVPQVFTLPGTTLVRGARYPALAAAFTDHLPDRLQRPPSGRVI